MFNKLSKNTISKTIEEDVNINEQVDEEYSNDVLDNAGEFSMEVIDVNNANFSRKIKNSSIK